MCGGITGPRTQVTRADAPSAVLTRTALRAHGPATSGALSLDEPPGAEAPAGFRLAPPASHLPARPARAAPRDPGRGRPRPPPPGGSEPSFSSTLFPYLLPSRGRRRAPTQSHRRCRRWGSQGRPSQGGPGLAEEGAAFLGEMRWKGTCEVGHPGQLPLRGPIPGLRAFCENEVSAPH